MNQKLSELCRVQQSLYNRNYLLDIAVNMFNYLGAIISYLIISVPIFSGQIYHEGLTMAVQLFSLDSFSSFIPICGEKIVLLVALSFLSIATTTN